MSLFEIIKKRLGIKSQDRKLSELILEQIQQLEHDTVRDMAIIAEKRDKAYIEFKKARVQGESEQILMSLASKYYWYDCLRNTLTGINTYTTNITKEERAGGVITELMLTESTVYNILCARVDAELAKEND